MIDGWSITAIEHSQPGVRAIESNLPWIHFLVDDDKQGIALVFDGDLVKKRPCGGKGDLYMVGLKKSEAKLFCRELIGNLDQHLEVTV